MLILCVKDTDVKDNDKLLSIVDNKLLFNNTGVESLKEYKNFGKNVTVISASNFALDGIEYSKYDILLQNNRKAQESSYFTKIASVYKPNNFTIKYIEHNGDFILFFEDPLAAGYFMHERLSAKISVFPDKNDNIDCITYDSVRETYVRDTMSVMIDILSFSYFELSCDGAVIEDVIDDDYLVPIRFSPANSNDAFSIDVISNVTDSYLLTFKEKGTYIVMAKNKNSVYNTQNFYKIIVC